MGEPAPSGYITPRALRPTSTSVIGEATGRGCRSEGGDGRPALARRSFDVQRGPVPGIVVTVDPAGERPGADEMLRTHHAASSVTAQESAPDAERAVGDDVVVAQDHHVHVHQRMISVGEHGGTLGQEGLRAAPRRVIGEHHDRVGRTREHREGFPVVPLGEGHVDLAPEVVGASHMEGHKPPCAGCGSCQGHFLLGAHRASGTEAEDAPEVRQVRCPVLVETEVAREVPVAPRGKLVNRGIKGDRLVGPELQEDPAPEQRDTPNEPRCVDGPTGKHAVGNLKGVEKRADTKAPVQLALKEHELVPRVPRHCGHGCVLPHLRTQLLVNPHVGLGHQAL